MIDILGSKIRKNDTPTPDHERWLGDNDKALAESERRVPAHTHPIDVIARDRDIGDTAYFNTIRRINPRAKEFFTRAISLCSGHSQQGKCESDASCRTR